MIESIPFHSERERERRKKNAKRDNPRVIGYSSYPLVVIERKIRVTDVDEKNYSGQLTWKAFRIWRTYTMQSGTWELFTLDLVVSK